MSDTHEPSYYEIALTNRQVLVAFVMILGCVLAAFLSGVWLGSKGREPISGEGVAVAMTAEQGELAQLEEFKFFAGDEPVAEGDQGEDLRKPDLSGLLEQRRPETTLAEDVGNSPPPPPPTAETPPPTVTPPPPPPPPAAVPPAAQQRPQTATERAASASSDGFVIQVFSTRERPQADKVTQQLKDAGHQAYLSPVEVGNQTMYRVRIGPFKRRAAAEQVARQVNESFKLDTWITAASN